MFSTPITRVRLNFSDPKLTDRYCEIHEIDDWRELPAQEILDLAFQMGDYWRERAKSLNAATVAGLLDQTRVEPTSKPRG